jgi:hypothetical protein
MIQHLQYIHHQQTSSRQSWQCIIANENHTMRDKLQLRLNDGTIEWLHNQMSEKKKQILNEQPKRSKLKVEINCIKGHTNQHTMPVNHKVEFEVKLYHCLEEQHRQPAPDTKATIM